jgi:hypothetical protein
MPQGLKPFIDFASDANPEGLASQEARCDVSEAEFNV